MFRNESDVVARKAEIKYEELSKTTAQKSYHAVGFPSFTNSELQSTTPSSQSSNLTSSLIPSIEDQAVGFFFANYVQLPMYVNRGQFDWLPSLLKGSKTEPIVQASLMAAGLSGLSIRTKSPWIMKRAQEEYVSALGMTNQALRDPKIAVKDSTVVSVILLGMYENFSCENKHSLEAWARHIRGACALLNLRGENQIHRDLGLRIVQQIYATALLVALETRTAVPEGIVQLWEAACPVSDFAVTGRNFTRRLVRFLTYAVELSIDTTSDPRTLVAAAIEHFDEMNKLKELVPQVWQFETLYLDEPSAYIYGKSYQVSLDPWIAQMWNNFRMTQLVVHQVIISQLQEGLRRDPPLFTPAEVVPQTRRSRYYIRSAAAHICGSVPQFTGQIPFPGGPSYRAKPSSSCADFFDAKDPRYKPHPPGTFINPTKPFGMHHLIYPLYLVGESELSPPDLRQWVIDQLLFIALKIGNRKAIVLANHLKQMVRPEPVTDDSSASSTDA
jgi:hypothetical protein